MCLLISMYKNAWGLYYILGISVHFKFASRKIKVNVKIRICKLREEAKLCEIP